MPSHPALYTQNNRLSLLWTHSGSIAEIRHALAKQTSRTTLGSESEEFTTELVALGNGYRVAVFIVATHRLMLEEPWNSHVAVGAALVITLLHGRGVARKRNSKLNIFGVMHGKILGKVLWHVMVCRPQALLCRSQSYGNRGRFLARLSHAGAKNGL